MAGADRRSPGAAWQCRDAVSCTPTAQSAGKKKSLHAAERDTERVQTRRTACREAGEVLDVQRLKCVDESGATLAMTRRYGRATPGPRVVESVPDNSGAHHTMLAAWSLHGLDAPWVVDGAVNGAMFHCWVSEVLGPPLPPGDIVLWDNRSAHTVAGGAELLAARGTRRLRLSPSAPDSHPIEPCWSKIKTWLRRAKARTAAALIEAMKDALDTVTETDMRGWFAHCGYPVH
jgi:transposase